MESDLIAESTAVGMRDGAGSAAGTSVEARLAVALFRSPPEFQSFSMDGYATALHDALKNLEGPSLRVEVVRPRRSRLIAGSQGAGAPRLLQYWRRYPAYMRYARTVRFDVSHVLDHAYGHLLYALKDTAAVVTCHDIFPLKWHLGKIPGLEARKLPPFTVRYSLAGLRRAQRVITPTASTRDDLVNVLGLDPQRIVVIPYGVDSAFLGAPTERETHRSVDRKTMLSVDTGALYKNQRGLIEVLARVRRECPGVRLLHAGVPLPDEIRRRARRLRVDGAIVELGRTQPSEMPGLYAGADLLLFPSYYEGFGWPPLEAMASGTPVVCSRAPAVKEVTQGRALDADADDYDGLAEHAVRVLEDDAAAAALRRDGIGHAATFTWERAAIRTVAVYRRAMAEVES